MASPLKLTSKIFLAASIVALLAILATVGFLAYRHLSIKSGAPTPTPAPSSTQSSTANPTPTSVPLTTNPTPTQLSPEEYSQLNVKITDFSLVDKQWYCLGGLTFDCGFKMTIENMGDHDLSGLELKVSLFNNGQLVHVGNYFSCANENGAVTETLHAGEARSCNGALLCIVGDNAYGTNLSSKDTTLVVQVFLNNHLLAQKKH
jgi:hypothetical protein